MKVSAEEKPKLGIALKLFLWVNIFNSFALIAAYLATHISPNSFAYFSYFGLSYPIWLGIALFFIVFWVIFRWKLAWVSIVTILIGFSHLLHFFAFNYSDSTLNKKVKVVSYNVHIFNLYDLDNRITNRNSIFNFLKEEDAGVYCFQEFYHQDGSTNFVTKDSMVDLLNTPQTQ